MWAYPRIPVKLGDHEPRAQKGIFVGYSDETMGGYRIYFPVSNTFVHSNHVTFGKYPNRSNNDTEIEETTLESMLNNLNLEQLARHSLTKTSTNILNDMDVQEDVTASLQEDGGDLIQ